MLIYQSQLENANRKKNLEAPGCLGYYEEMKIRNPKHEIRNKSE